MQCAITQLKGWGGKSGRTVFIALAFSIAIMSGCATSGKVEQEAADSNPAVPEETTVERLSDGREGFIIREPPIEDSDLHSEFQQAITLMDEGADEEAIELFEKLIARFPGLTAPHINVSMAYRHTDQTEAAEEHLKTALELVPAHPVASNEYGLLLRRSGRFKEARIIYERSLERFPGYLPVRKNLGILCELYLDDPGCALEQYEIYSEVRPEDKEIKTGIADLRLRSKID